jgi:hypothetical protein
MIHTHKCVECQVSMTCCCEDRRDVDRLTGKRRSLRCLGCEPVDVHHPNPFDEVKTVSREGSAPAASAENAAETSAGGPREETKADPPAPAAPLGMRGVLVSGMALIESSLNHVSHGGPSRTDAETWLTEARKVLQCQ